MTNPIKLYTILFLSFLYAGTAGDAVGGENVKQIPALNLTIKFADDKHRQGSPLIIEVSLENSLDTPILQPFFPSDEQGAVSQAHTGMFVLDFLVEKKSGAVFKKINTQRPAAPLLSFPGGWSKRIAPGKTWTFQVDLRLWAIEKPQVDSDANYYETGEYQITALWDLAPMRAQANAAQAWPSERKLAYCSNKLLLVITP